MGDLPACSLECVSLYYVRLETHGVTMPAGHTAHIPLISTENIGHTNAAFVKSAVGDSYPSYLPGRGLV